MRSFVFMLAVVCSVCPAARAQPPAVPITASSTAPGAGSTEDSDARFAIGLNSPVAWLGRWFGATLSGRVGDHFAVRANVASYTDVGPRGTLGALANAYKGGDTGYGGRIFDVGIGGVWYPRRAWDGFLIELGALRRDRDTFVWPAFDPKVTTRSTTYAARALLGWSWLFKQRAFIAVAAGASWGRESGRETREDEDGITMTRPVRRKQVDGETYVRFGIVFGR